MLYAVIMGGLSGWIAGNIMGLRGGILKNVVIGVAGSAIGSFLFGLLGFYGRMLANLIVGVAGACILLRAIDRLA